MAKKSRTDEARADTLGPTTTEETEPQNRSGPVSGPTDAMRDAVAIGGIEPEAEPVEVSDAQRAAALFDATHRNLGSLFARKGDARECLACSLGVRKHVRNRTPVDSKPGSCVNADCLGHALREIGAIE